MTSVIFLRGDSEKTKVDVQELVWIFQLVVLALITRLSRTPPLSDALYPSFQTRVSSKTQVMESLSIDSLKIQPHQRSKGTQEAEVAESWEDEELDSGTETPTEAPGPSLKQINSNDDPPGPPPPTPISPAQSNPLYDWSPAHQLGGGRPQPVSGSGPGTPRSDSDSERKRPEKTTATAGRMIAASLGLKAPKKTEEQRQYERATKEQEIKRRNREKEMKEQESVDDEKAKAAMWTS